MMPLLWDAILVMATAILLAIPVVSLYERSLARRAGKAKPNGGTIPVSPCAVRSHFYRIAYVTWRCDVCGEECIADRPKEASW